MITTLSGVTPKGDKTRLTIFSDHFLLTSEKISLSLMTSRLSPDASFWERTLARCLVELSSLPQSEIDWLKDRLSLIARLQGELDRLFRAANGPACCASCPERCCGCGRHHFTLTNLLGFLLQGTTPPGPDYNRACPFGGAAGCDLKVAFRPYNCVSFVCDQVESGMGDAERNDFYRIEKQLRGAYQAVADRYPAASLQGLLIALERTGDRPLLQRRAGRR